MAEKALIERHVRRILSELGPHDTLTTAELGAMITVGMQPYERSMAFNQLTKLGEHNRELCNLVPAEATKGFHKGKTINRRVWHRIESPDMPQRPATPSAGAASPGTSLADRVQALEDWRAQCNARNVTLLDPLSTVL